MPRIWSPEQAASLAPDPASLKAGQALAAPRKWTALGQDGRFVWGLAQGSGKEPYQAQIDLDEPAFKCSCPSRKFPCKHGLGLLMLHATSPAPEASRPAWVEEWAIKRAERIAKAEAKAQSATSETPTSPADPEAQARRREKRAANVYEGLEFLDSWLRDLARQGLAAARSSPASYWDTCARRLIDSQAAGLARRVRHLATLAIGAKGDSYAFEAALGRLHLLATTARRRESLPPDWQTEIDSLLGWSLDQEELRTHTGETAVWFAAAQETLEDAGIHTRITHLFSSGRRPARLLEFSHASRAIVSPLALGRAFSAELIRYPGILPERALFKSAPLDAERPPLELISHCDALRQEHCSNLSINPWREETPALVELTPTRQGENWLLQDESGDQLPLLPEFPRAWDLFACSGGNPLSLCILWDGHYARPLSILDSDTTLPLNT